MPLPKIVLDVSPADVSSFRNRKWSEMSLVERRWLIQTLNKILAREVAQDAEEARRRARENTTPKTPAEAAEFFMRLGYTRIDHDGRVVPLSSIAECAPAP